MGKLNPSILDDNGNYQGAHLTIRYKKNRCIDSYLSVLIAGKAIEAAMLCGENKMWGNIESYVMSKDIGAKMASNDIDKMIRVCYYHLGVTNRFLVLDIIKGHFKDAVFFFSKKRIENVSINLVLMVIKKHFKLDESDMQELVSYLDKEFPKYKDAA